MTTFKYIIFALCLCAMPAMAQKYVGGDISSLTTNEAKNPTWLDHDGNAISSCLDFFKQEGLNTMRVRLFVAPDKYTGSDKDANACQDIAYVKALGKRIKDAGYNLLLDFHYSDTWADPAKQWTPADWSSLSDEELYEKIYSYTKEALTELVNAGAAPDFIQTGNEISYGMLWGGYGSSSLKKCYSGSSANWARFTQLLKKAGAACREVCPAAKIILHTERAAQQSVLVNFYDQMASAEVDYDIIGLSYYPIWHGTLTTLESALNTLEAKYSKDIMIVETGAAYSWLPDSRDYTPAYAASEAGQQQFAQELVAMLNKHSRVTGLFWWWMEYNAYPWATTKMDGWWYAPLFNSNNGKALAALSELKNFLGTSTAIEGVTTAPASADDAWYNLSGQRIQEPSRGGVYIHQGKKTVVK